MLDELRSSLSDLLDPVMSFLDGVQRLGERGLSDLHVPYAAQLAVLRVAWALVALALLAGARGVWRLLAILVVGLVTMKAYGVL